MLVFLRSLLRNWRDVISDCKMLVHGTCRHDALPAHDVGYDPPSEFDIEFTL
jgi:hypothetical protein